MNLNSGSIVLAKITQIETYGLFLEHENTATRIFVHVSDVPGSKESSLSEKMTVGESLEVQILQVAETKEGTKEALAMATK